MRFVYAENGSGSIRSHDLRDAQTIQRCIRAGNRMNNYLIGKLAKEKYGEISEPSYANVSQLVCLSNLENLNAVFINEGISQSERLAKLNAIAISQMKVLTEDHRLLQLEAADDTEKPQ